MKDRKAGGGLGKRPLCLAAAILAAVILLAEGLGISWIWRSPAGKMPEYRAVEEKEAQAEGIVYLQEEKTYQDQIVTYLYIKQTNLYINSKKYPIRNIISEVEGRQEPMAGRRIALEGVLSMTDKPGNPGEFDRKQYEQAFKIDFHLKTGKILEKSGRRGLIMSWKDAFCERCRDVLEAIFPRKEAGVLESMILGERELLDEEIRAGFQAAGISHILAISGLHISMLGAGIWSGLKWLGLPVPLASGCAAVLIACYGTVIGSPATAVRAMIMFGLMLGAGLFGRAYDLLSALAAAGILLLLDNPDLLFYSGFQMSFAAVAGLGSYGEFQKKLWGKQKKLAGSLLSGVTLWLFMLPVVLRAFYQVSVWGILCNLLVIPLMPFTLGSGLLALGLGWRSIRLGSIAGSLSYGLLRLYEWIGEGTSYAAVGVWTPGQPSIGLILLYYGVMGAACAAGRMFDRREQRQKALGIQLVSWIFLVFLMAAPWKGEDKITVLDVGQGDGIMVQTGNIQVLIDGGSSNRSQIGKYVILPYLKYEGISRLEGIFLTHTDRDHVNGAKEILEEARKGWLAVEQIFVPEWMEETEEGREIHRLSEACGAKWNGLKAGDRLTMGKARICVLHPGEGEYQEDPNGGSLVFTWETDSMKAVFTGDLPGEKEKELLGEKEKELLGEKGKELLRELADCNILKVAHHGSKYSTSEEFLRKVQPELALISCGDGNRYGHPGEETLLRLRESGCRIMRTDTQGALSVIRWGKKWTARGFVQNGLAQIFQEGYTIQDE